MVQLEYNLILIEFINPLPSLLDTAPYFINDFEIREYSVENKIIDVQLPPIIDDPEAAARLAKQTEEAGDFMQSMSGGNMAVSLILQGSTQSLWGMIREIQVITFTTLISANLQNVLFIFLVSVIQFA